MSTLTAQEARETAIFIINSNQEIEETNLFDHVAESAEETTSPRGIMTKLFIEGLNGILYKSRAFDNEIITEREYDKLDEEFQEEYQPIGEAVIAWELREWMPNGKSILLETYDSEEDVDNEWFDRTYKFDFLLDDQRDTMYWYTIEEAEAGLAERNS